MTVDHTTSVQVRDVIFNRSGLTVTTVPTLREVIPKTVSDTLTTILYRDYLFGPTLRSIPSFITETKICITETPWIPCHNR